MNEVETACLLLVVLFGLLLYCYTKNKDEPYSRERFGTNDRPFEPENTLLHRNPWDDIDYIVPEYNKTYYVAG